MDIYGNMDPINIPPLCEHIYQHHGSYGIWRFILINNCFLLMCNYLQIIYLSVIFKLCMVFCYLCCQMFLFFFLIIFFHIYIYIVWNILMNGQIDSWNQRCIDLGTDLYVYIYIDI